MKKENIQGYPLSNFDHFLVKMLQICRQAFIGRIADSHTCL